jgi:Cu2+-exporting ATPase
VNLSDCLQVEVRASGASTRVGKLIESMHQAARRRAPIVRLADRVAGKFVLAVLVAAAGCFALWSVVDPARALDCTIALLVVSCPCALAMATPLAVSAALGRAAKRGILVKGGEALEVLARPGLIVFDKTGTLTQGRLELLAWEGDVSLAPLVAALERRSAHPVAQALVRADATGDEKVGVEVHQTPGGGIDAEVGGSRLLVGSPGFVAARGASLPDWAKCAIERHAALARTPVLVSVDGEVRALAALGDPLRADARASLDELRRLGHELAIVSGDHPTAVAALARELGPLSQALGGVSPEEKLAFVERARARGQVATA